MQSTTVKQPERPRLFRVQNIPCAWSFGSFCAYLKDCFSSERISVTSFHPSCFHNNKTKTAIISFADDVPTILGPLAENFGSEIGVVVNSENLCFDEAFLALTTLYVPDNEDDVEVDIFTLHGIGSHAVGTWVSKVGSCWPREFLRRDFPNSRIMAFGHDSKLQIDSSTSRLSDYGMSFINAVLSSRSPEAKSRPLVLIGHSFGGTIITYVLHILLTVNMDGYSDLYHAIKCAVFFGTPHQGTSVDPLLSFTATRSEPSKERVLRDLEPGSDMLKVLRRALTSSTESIKFITCVEQKTAPTPSGSNGNRDSQSIHVDEREASIYSREELYIPVDADHKSMNKFTHPGNLSYQSIVSRLHQILPPESSKSQTFYFTAIDVLKQRDFIGRSLEINRLRELLSNNRQTQEISRAAIVGVAGVGKTQLALQYMKRYHAEYHISFSIDASTNVTFNNHVSALVRTLTGREPERVTSINLDIISRWMQENPKKRILILIDNLHLEDEALHISENGSGDIIITTRSEYTGKGFAKKNLVMLEEWSGEEACQFLRLNADDNVSDDTLLELSQEASQLPIAMDSLARYTSFAKQSLWDTLQDLRRGKAEFFKSVPERTTVNAAFEISFARLERMYPNAMRLASMLAFLDPNSLGELLFRESNEGFNLADQTLLEDLRIYQVRNTARMHLIDVGLLRQSTETGNCSFHDLGHVFVLDRLTDAEKVAYVANAVHFVWKNFPLADDTHIPNIWAIASYYLPHAVAVLRHAQKLDLKSAEVIDLLVRASGTLVEKGFGEDAERFSKLAHSYAYALPGYKTDKLIEAISSVGYVLNYMRDPRAARPYYEEAVDVALMRLRPEHEDTITSIHNLAGIFVEENDLAKAEKWFGLAVSYGRKHYLNADHGVNPFASMISLAEVYRRQGRFQEADDLLREAEIGFRARQSNESSWTLYCIAQRGKNMLERGLAGERCDWRKAEKKLVEGAEGLRAALGTGDRYTQEALSDLEKLREVVSRRS